MARWCILDGGTYWRYWSASKSSVEAYSKMVDIVERLIRDHGTVFLASDSLDAQWRYEISPCYKEGREKRPEDARQANTDWQAWCARQQCQTGGLVQVIQEPGYEADDVAFGVALQLCEHEHEPDLLLHSADKDWVQCMLAPSVRRQTINDVHGPADVMRRWGVYPASFALLLAVAGDSADAVRGCPSVGIARAAEAISEACGATTLAELAEGLGEAPAGKMPVWEASLRSWLRSPAASQSWELVRLRDPGSLVWL